LDSGVFVFVCSKKDSSLLDYVSISFGSAIGMCSQVFAGGMSDVIGFSWEFDE